MNSRHSRFLGHNQPHRRLWHFIQIVHSPRPQPKAPARPLQPPVRWFAMTPIGERVQQQWGRQTRLRRLGHKNTLGVLGGPGHRLPERGIGVTKEIAAPGNRRDSPCPMELVVRALPRYRDGGRGAERSMFPKQSRRSIPAPSPKRVTAGTETMRLKRLVPKVICHLTIRLSGARSPRHQAMALYRHVTPFMAKRS